MTKQKTGELKIKTMQQLELTLKSSCMEVESAMSLNMPSNLDVNWQPHSCFSLEIMFFSLSSDTLLLSNNRLAEREETAWTIKAQSVRETDMRFAN